MRRIRFHIASLLIAVSFVAVGFAALRESSELWDNGLFTLTLAVLLASILLAVHRSEARRAFWLGFAVFGLSYLGLSLIPSIESRLITTKALKELDSEVPGRNAGFLQGPVLPGGHARQSHHDIKTRDREVWDATTGRLLGGWAGTTENFVRIGHSLFALLAGWFGGPSPAASGELPDPGVGNGGASLIRETHAHDRHRFERSH